MALGPLYCHGNQNTYKTIPIPCDKMVIPEVEEILIKYKSQEEKIENVLHKSWKDGTSGSVTNIDGSILSLAEAEKRNQQILKELEFVKGNLRSKSIFSPTEVQWEKLCEQYKNNPALPVKTWHCHLPVFV
ncbi:unnamed protein product [Ceutorhynchus assimilis]|uniref:Uncharacterized protein n=1 Tax=Ceutorhynchus assimilis TaxID=467358 RepID=A0A9N9QFZ7_9CUCU|nr:unnamed protein product [Ceutorhynchus assimilis]